MNVVQKENKQDDQETAVSRITLEIQKRSLLGIFFLLPSKTMDSNNVFINYKQKLEIQLTNSSKEFKRKKTNDRQSPCLYRKM